MDVDLVMALDLVSRGTLRWEPKGRLLTYAPAGGDQLWYVEVGAATLRDWLQLLALLEEDAPDEPVLEGTVARWLTGMGAAATEGRDPLVDLRGHLQRRRAGSPERPHLVSLRA